MTIEQLTAGLSDFKKLKEDIEKAKGESKIKDYLKQYEVTGHEVFDKAKREDKPIKDDNGTIEKYEKVARLGLPIQKMIAQRSAAFLCANPIQLDAAPEGGDEEKLLAALTKTWDDNKLDYKSIDLAEKMMGETEVAELWYTEQLGEDEKLSFWTAEGVKAEFKLRMRVLANSLGDTLHPVFDPTGNMIAFGRGYTFDNAGQKEEHFDLYTDTQIYKGTKGQGDWEVVPEANVIGKIPIVYYWQSAPEWADVQSLIDRLEAKISNHADTNDYFDSPVLFLEGTISSMPEKGKQGKVIVGENGAKANYVTWNEAPDSTKMEIENLLRFIHSCTDTPDISFDNLKGLGTTSGFALQMMFMGAHLKAARKAGIFGEGVQRRINYLKAALCKLDVSLEKGKALTIKPQFEFFLPKDVKELMETLSTGVMGGIVSKRTAIRKLELADDVEGEIEQIEGEQNSPTAANQAFNQAA